MWFVIVLMLSTFLALRWWKVGPQAAVGETLLWSLLVPTWISIPVGDIPLDVRSTIACVGLVAYCFHRDARFRTRLRVADYAAIALLVVHFASDSINDGFTFTIVARGYGEWIVPYLAGRASVAEYADVRRLRSTACIVAIALAAWAAVESVSGTNPVTSLVGERPADRMAHRTERWGLKRAEGPTTHPIWSGMTQAMLLPWAISGANAAFRSRSGLWMLAAPPAIVAGVFFSLSRGPWGLVVLTFFGTAVGLFPRARKFLLVGGAVLIAAVLVWREPTLRFVQQLTSPTGGSRTVEVDGEEVRFDSTTYRLILWKVYRQAMWRAGLFGFGTDRTSTFPVRVPVGTLDPETMRRVESIDNQYILLDLRFGLLGVLSLVGLVGGAAASAFRRGTATADSSRVFLVAVGALLGSMLFIFAVEWMPLDYGFALLWTCGLSTGLDAYPRRTNIRD
jgi:hypothetical protein